MRPAKEIMKENAMGVDLTIKAEDSPTNCSSSSRRRRRNSLSLSNSHGRSNSSSTQYSSNRRNGSDMAAGVEHSCPGGPHHIIRIYPRVECVTDVEGGGISTRNDGQLLRLSLTSLLFQVQTSLTTAIFLPLQYRTCTMDHLLRASGSRHHLSQCRYLHRFRAHHHTHHPSHYPTSFYEPSVPPSDSDRRFSPRAFTAQLAPSGKFLCIHVASTPSAAGRRYFPDMCRHIFVYVVFASTGISCSCNLYTPVRTFYNKRAISEFFTFPHGT